VESGATEAIDLHVHGDNEECEANHGNGEARETFREREAGHFAKFESPVFAGYVVRENG
jgi:hypothetical protein